MSLKSSSKLDIIMFSCHQDPVIAKVIISIVSIIFLEGTTVTQCSIYIDFLKIPNKGCLKRGMKNPVIWKCLIKSFGV